MDFTDIKDKTEKELHDALHVQRNLLRELRFQASEGQLKNVQQIHDAKKTIARILTLLTQRKMVGQSLDSTSVDNVTKNA